jgi:hypothetical protein
LKTHDFILLGLCGVFLCVSLVEYALLKKKPAHVIEYVNQNKPLIIEKPTAGQLADTNYVNWLLSEVNAWRTDEWLYYSTNQNQMYIELKTRWLMLKIKPVVKWNMVSGQLYLKGIGAGYARRIYEDEPLYIGANILWMNNEFIPGLWLSYMF